MKFIPVDQLAKDSISEIWFVEGKYSVPVKFYGMFNGDNPVPSKTIEQMTEHDYYLIDDLLQNHQVNLKSVEIFGEKKLMWANSHIEFFTEKA